MACERPTIVFAGGGTGGHVLPSLAIAERLPEQADRLGVDLPRVHFVCSARRLDAEILRKAGRPFTPLPVVGLSGHPLQWPRFAFRQLRAIHVARCDLTMRRAGLVVSLGGYVAHPVVVAARRMAMAVILLNLDAVAGKANRRLARRADAIYTVHAGAGLPGHARPVAFPVRRQALAPGDPAGSRRRLGLDPERPVLLVTGASQGAMTINHALIELAGRGFFNDGQGDPAGWQVLHLAGEGHVEAVEAAYRQRGVAGQVMPFCDAMGLAWDAADLAVSRAGAGSAAEVRANAVPAIFMPYPYHRDQHQRHNVADLVERDAAVVLEDRRDAGANARALGPVLRQLMSDAARRERMRRALGDGPGADGAALLAAAALAMLPDRQTAAPPGGGAS